MAPIASSSSDEVMNLPRVPRVRRGAVKTGNSAQDSSARPPKSENQKGKALPQSSRKSRESTLRTRGKKRQGTDSVQSDEDEDDIDEESEENVPMRRAKRAPRRAIQARKIVDDEDEEEDDDDNADGDDVIGEEDDAGGDGDDEGDNDDDESKDRDSESESVSLSRGEKKVKQAKDMSSGSISRDDDEVDDESEDMKKVNAGRDKILAELEEAEAMDDGSDPLDSDDSVVEKGTKKTERLTRRQRAMQGENVKLEYTKLESPKAKKAAPPEEAWSNDEEAELKKQQRARLRQMIHEKRNKEKRAAMVDKVLRGVTSKRKKLTMASEERVAKVGTRLSKNEMRKGCIRFVSNPTGTSLSIPEEDDAPAYLQESLKAVYPKPCLRDPRTGKRIFTDA